MRKLNVILLDHNEELNQNKMHKADLVIRLHPLNVIEFVKSRITKEGRFVSVEVLAELFGR